MHKIEKKKNMQQVSLSVVSAMDRVWVQYPLWNFVFFSMYSCSEIEYTLVHHVM